MAQSYSTKYCYQTWILRMWPVPAIVKGHKRDCALKEEERDGNNLLST